MYMIITDILAHISLNLALVLHSSYLYAKNVFLFLLPTLIFSKFFIQGLYQS